MNEAIKAIPTRYKGYHFRSRLEARWAVFFDALGIEFEYEPDGVNVGGRGYLPDFRLIYSDLFFEVKPTLDKVEMDDRLEKFPKGLLVVCGNPWPWEYTLFTHLEMYGSDRKLTAMPTWRFAACRCCRWVAIANSDVDAKLCYSHIPLTRQDPNCSGVLNWTQPIRKTASHLSEFPVERAYAGARSARFEHGESGAT